MDARWMRSRKRGETVEGGNQDKKQTAAKLKSKVSQLLNQKLSPLFQMNSKNFHPKSTSDGR